mgnify:CR=1 FL=1
MAAILKAISLKEMSEYESEVNGYLAEMGFTL